MPGAPTAGFQKLLTSNGPGAAQNNRLCNGRRSPPSRQPPPGRAPGAGWGWSRGPWRPGTWRRGRASDGLVRGSARARLRRSPGPAGRVLWNFSASGDTDRELAHAPCEPPSEGGAQMSPRHRFPHPKSRWNKRRHQALCPEGWGRFSPDPTGPSVDGPELSIVQSGAWTRGRGCPRGSMCGETIPGVGPRPGLQPADAEQARLSGLSVPTCTRRSAFREPRQSTPTPCNPVVLNDVRMPCCRATRQTHTWDPPPLSPGSPPSSPCPSYSCPLVPHLPWGGLAWSKVLFLHDT